MKIKLTEAVTADQIRQSMSGFVGPKFAKKASDEDIMKMVDLKDKIAKLQNTHILPIQKQIDALYKQYKIKSNKGIEESTSMNEGVITIALGVAGGLILLRILGKLLKTILSGIGMNVKLSKERLIEVTETMMDSALKQVISGKGGMQGSDFMAFLHVKQHILEQINSGKVNTIKDIVNIIKLAEKGKLNVKESKSQK